MWCGRPRPRLTTFTFADGRKKPNHSVEERPFKGRVKLCFIPGP